MVSLAPGVAWSQIGIVNYYVLVIINYYLLIINY